MIGKATHSFGMDGLNTIRLGWWVRPLYMNDLTDEHLGAAAVLTAPTRDLDDGELELLTVYVPDLRRFVDWGAV